MFESGLHFGFLAHDPDIVLHDLLQIALHGVGIVPVAVLEGPERLLRQIFQRRLVDSA